MAEPNPRKQEAAMARRKGATLPLNEFEGAAVRQVTIQITKAGDGLSDALDVEPTPLAIGDSIFLVLKGVVSKVTHKQVTPATTDLARSHTIVTTDVALIDEADAKPLLDQVRDRLRLVAEAKAGVTRLPEGEVEDEPDAGEPE